MPFDLHPRKQEYSTGGTSHLFSHTCPCAVRDSLRRNKRTIQGLLLMQVVELKRFVLWKTFGKTCAETVENGGPNPPGTARKLSLLRLHHFSNVEILFKNCAWRCSA